MCTISFPAFYIVFNFRHLRAVERRALYAIPLLPAIIVEEEERLLPQVYYSAKVHYGNASHKQVADAPYQVQGCHCSEEHHDGSVHNSQEPYPPLLAGQEFHVHLSVGVVAYDAAESKQEDGYGDKRCSDRADLALQC